MTDDRLPVCLVGCGLMGQRHIRGYATLAATGLATVELVAVCDLDADSAEQAAALAAELLGQRPAVHRSIDPALDDERVAAFDLCTEPISHHLLAEPALTAGRHVLCEKPLGITLRACRRMLAAQRASGAVLATAENYRWDPPNRLARAVLDAGLLGDVHLLVQHAIGGGDQVIISPWRHRKDRGAIGVDMGVHYTDLIQFLLGEFDSVFGRGLIAEPVRRRGQETVEATGEDSVIAQYRMRSGVTAQLAFVPSGPGARHFQRSVHGRAGSMALPRDRSGEPVELRLGDRQLRGDEIAGELDGFDLGELSARLFGRGAITYDLPFAGADAALIALELHDFGTAVMDGRAPEVDGQVGMTAMAAVLGAYESDRARRSVTMEELLSGAVSAYQDELDEALAVSEPAS